LTEHVEGEVDSLSNSSWEVEVHYVLLESVEQRKEADYSTGCWKKGILPMAKEEAEEELILSLHSIACCFDVGVNYSLECCVEDH
jgi:hypothetical protein